MAMEHGRDHQDREAHSGKPRANNTPPEDEQAGPGPAERRPVVEGSAVAPTRRAEQRERERHERERAIGRAPAGEEGRLREERGPAATRERLDAAAREADAQIAEDGAPRLPITGQDDE